MPCKSPLVSCTIRYSENWSLYWMSAFQTVFLKWISMLFFKDVWVVCIDSHGVNPPIMRVGYPQYGNKGLSLRSSKLLILFQLWFTVKVSTNVHYAWTIVVLVTVQFSRSVMSDSLWLHELQHARPPCPSPTAGVYPNPCPLSQWCRPIIPSSVVPFSSCLQSFPASGSFQISPLHQVVKVLEFQLQHQSFQWIFRTDFLSDRLAGSPFSPRNSQESSPTPQDWLEKVSFLV